MDFELSDEQRLLRDTIRSFVDEQIRPVAREMESGGQYPDEIVATMRKMGLFGLLVPEEYGGLAADMVSLAVVFEEISRGWMGVAGIIGSHSLSCAMIAQFGTEEQKQAHLPALASGERRTGIALTEPGAGSDLQGIATSARRDGDRYVINGRKTWITNARHADPLPVLVKTDPGAKPAHAGMSVLLYATTVSLLLALALRFTIGLTRIRYGADRGLRQKRPVRTERSVPSVADPAGPGAAR